jgi:hypothetical protein
MNNDNDIDSRMDAAVTKLGGPLSAHMIEQLAIAEIFAYVWNAAIADAMSALSEKSEDPAHAYLNPLYFESRIRALQRTPKDMMDLVRKFSRS